MGPRAALCAIWWLGCGGDGTALSADGPNGAELSAADDLTAGAGDLALADAQLPDDLATADFAVTGDGAAPDLSACVARLLDGLPAWYVAGIPGTLCIPRAVAVDVLGQKLICCDSVCTPGDGGEAGCIVTLTVHAALGDAGAFEALIDVAVSGTDTATAPTSSTSCPFTGSGPGSSYRAHLEVADDGGTARVSPSGARFTSTTQYSSCPFVATFQGICPSYDENYIGNAVQNLSGVVLRNDSAQCP